MKNSVTNSVLLAIVLSGCASYVPPAPVLVPFDAPEYSALPTTGTGTVKGQVFAKTVGGDVKKGAGNTVRLMPATPSRLRAYNARDNRHEVADFVKLTDGDGKFQFENVPPGDYHIATSLTWKTISTNEYSRRLGLMDTQGGPILREVKVEDGKTAELMLTP